MRVGELPREVHNIYISGQTLGRAHTAFTARPHWLLEVEPTLLRNTANPICWFPLAGCRNLLACLGTHTLWKNVPQKNNYFGHKRLVCLQKGTFAIEPHRKALFYLWGETKSLPKIKKEKEVFRVRITKFVPCLMLCTSDPGSQDPTLSDTLSHGRED